MSPRKCQLGNKHCQCSTKERLRKVFTDHVIFTKAYIESYFSEAGETKIVLARLLKNQVDIGRETEPFIGKEKAKKLVHLLKQHIVFAGNAIAAVKTGEGLEHAVAEVFKNSKMVAEFLSALNPQALPFKVVHEMFDTHNKQVLQLTEDHHKGKYEKEVKLFDHYLQHMLKMSDAIAHALDPK